MKTTARKNLTEKTVSVIVTTYNWPSALKLSVESLYKQSIYPNEIIIADDGSGNATKQVVDDLIKKAPKEICVKHVWQEDKGFRLTAIRNKALAAATSEYIIQIDGDCVADIHFIEDHLSMAKEKRFLTGSRVFVDKKTTETFCKSGNFNKTKIKMGLDRRISAIRCNLLKKLISPIYKRNNISSLRGCNMSYFLNDIKKINGYNEDFEGWGHEDLEINFRFHNLGIKKMNVKFGAILYHLYHEEKSRANDASNKELAYQSYRNKITRIENGMDKYLTDSNQ